MPLPLDGQAEVQAQHGRTEDAPPPQDEEREALLAQAQDELAALQVLLGESEERVKHLREQEQEQRLMLTRLALHGALRPDSEPTGHPERKAHGSSTDP